MHFFIQLKPFAASLPKRLKDILKKWRLSWSRDMVAMEMSQGNVSIHHMNVVSKFGRRAVNRTKVIAKTLFLLIILVSRPTAGIINQFALPNDTIN